MRQLTTWLSMFVLAAVDAWGAPPEQQPPGDVRQISVGEEVNGVLLNLGDEEFFELRLHGTASW